MKNFRLCITYKCTKVIDVEAENLEEATVHAHEDFDTNKQTGEYGTDWIEVDDVEYPGILGDRNYSLITRGAKNEGTLNPDEILHWFEEELYVNESHAIVEFLKWCHANDKRFGHGNYEVVYAEFLDSVFN